MATTKAKPRRTKARAESAPKPVALNRQIKDLSDEFLRCRYPNHWWETVDVKRVMMQGERYVRVDFECRCGATRNDILGPKGERYSSGIKYPEGYVIKGYGKVDRQTFRNESIGRYLREA